MVVGSTAIAATAEKAISVTPMTMTINGQTVTPLKSDGTPAEVFAYDGATYVSLRYLSELLGIEVQWDKNDPNTAKLVSDKITVPAPGGDGTYTGAAAGFGGDITATVTVSGGKITACTLVGDKETPTIGGAALEPLRQAILAAGTVDGVDGVSGATWTSNGVFAAVRKAMGIVENEPGSTNSKELSATGLAHGLGVASSGQVGPGKDDQGVQVYSFNTPVVGACFDAKGKIVAIFSDMMEIATPNYDGEFMPHFTGFPGQSYNADANHDEKVDEVWTQDDDTFLAQVENWRTKRERGDTYKLSSGTWSAEMDIFEGFFTDKTTAEIDKWYTESCSDLNGRPLRSTSTKAEDIAKLEKLTDAQKADLDAISGATMSLNDPHGNILKSIDLAWSNAKDTNIALSAQAGKDELQMGMVYGAPHGTKTFGQAYAVVQGDVIVAAFVDEFQFVAAGTEGVTPVPNSDSDFAQGYAEGKVLASKRVMADYYSNNMATKAGSTVRIDDNFDAIQSYAVGKTIAQVEAVAGGDKTAAVDAVSGATLVSTANYVGVIAAAAEK